MLKRLVIRVCAVSFPVLASGCATSPLVQNIVNTDRPDYIVISERVSFQPKMSAFSDRMEFGLLPGTYKAEKENSFGTYYRGDGNLVWQRNVTFSSFAIVLHQGGIWLPKAEGAPRVYYVLGEQTLTTKDLDSVDRSVGKSSNEGLSNLAVSYTENAGLTGKPVGPAAVGAVIAAGIGAALIQASAGEPALGPESNDPDFNEKVLKGLHVANPQLVQ